MSARFEADLTDAKLVEVTFLPAPVAGAVIQAWSEEGEEIFNLFMTYEQWEWMTKNRGIQTEGERRLLDV